MNEQSYIEVYPVGLLRDLRKARREWALFGNRRGAVRNLWYWFARSWRRRSYWNGYLAEWHYPPEMRLGRAGKGWTRRAALRSLGRIIVAQNQKPGDR